MDKAAFLARLDNRDWSVETNHGEYLDAVAHGAPIWLTAYFSEGTLDRFEVWNQERETEARPASIEVSAEEVPQYITRAWAEALTAVPYPEA